MSREALKTFIRAIERNYSLREEIFQCKTIFQFLSIANRLGFEISSKDLEEDQLSSEMGEWFKKSKIAAIKK